MLERFVERLPMYEQARPWRAGVSDRCATLLRKERPRSHPEVDLLRELNHPEKLNFRAVITDPKVDATNKTEPASRLG